MTYSVTFDIPVVTPLLNVTLRTHFREAKKVQQALAWHVRCACKPPRIPLNRARVVITRRSVGVPDQDNLVGGAKQLIDVLLVPQPMGSVDKHGKARVRHRLGLGFVVDDGPDHLTVEYVAVRVAHRKDEGTTIQITELPSTLENQ